MSNRRVVAQFVNGQRLILVLSGESRAAGRRWRGAPPSRRHYRAPARSLPPAGGAVRSRAMRSVVLCGLLAGLAGCQSGPSDPAVLARDVERLLAEAAAAWNRGDLEGFVSTYAVEPTTTFVSGGEVRHGFEWIRRNYAPRFAPGAARDSLRFERLETRALGSGHALATAHYVLFAGDSTTATGVFTLVMRRVGDRWLMIHDHTSR